MLRLPTLIFAALLSLGFLRTDAATTCSQPAVAIRTLDTPVSVSSNLSFPLAAAEGGADSPCLKLSTAELEITGDHIDERTAANKYLYVDVTYEFIPARGAPETSYDWIFEIRMTSFEDGFHSSTQYAIETEKSLRTGKGEYSGGLMVKANMYWFLFFRCADANPLCSKLHGDLQVRLSAVLKVDSCSLLQAANKTSSSSPSACVFCASLPGCGFCGHDTDFGGCWEGSELGPAYDNSLTCGNLRQSSTAVDTHWLFNYTADVCLPARKPEGDLFKVIAIVVISITISCMCLATCWYWYHRRQDSKEPEGEELGNFIGHHNEAESLFEMDHEFHFPDEDEPPDEGRETI